MIDWQKNVVAPCIGVFGEPATFAPASAPGSSFGISVVFDDAYKAVSMSSDGGEVMSLFPAAGVNLAEFPTPPVQGDHLTLLSTGKTYAVREPRPDSHGGAFLILNYVSG